MVSCSQSPQHGVHSNPMQCIGFTLDACKSAHLLTRSVGSFARTPTGAAPMDDRAAAHSPSAGAYAPAPGGRTPLRSHNGSGGTSPAAGYDLSARCPARQDHPRSYEPAGQPMSQPVSEHASQHAKSGYGSPLDLPRADYSNASELSTGPA